jgi:hypothetical protein
VIQVSVLVQVLGNDKSSNKIIPFRFCQCVLGNQPHGALAAVRLLRSGQRLRLSPPPTPHFAARGSFQTALACSIVCAFPREHWPRASGDQGHTDPRLPTVALLPPS